MSPPHLHILGIDPGGTTGWALLTVPRRSVFGRAQGEILDWDMGQLEGPEEAQVRALADKARQIQALDYQIGPALVVEDFDVAELRTTDAGVLYSPIRIAAMLRYAAYRGETGDALVTMQGRTIAKQAATDDRLRAWGLYDRHSGDHARDAMRHAITALRRAKASQELREAMWKPSYSDQMEMA